MCWDASGNVEKTWRVSAQYIACSRGSGLDFVVGRCARHTSRGGVSDVWRVTCSRRRASAGDGTYQPPPTGSSAGGCSPGIVAQRSCEPGPRQLFSDVVPANRGQVVEDANPEGHDRGDREVHPKLVADKGQAGSQCAVGQQPCEKHPWGEGA